MTSLALVIVRPELTLTHAALGLGSSVLHVFHLVSLQRGYRLAGLSSVYPTARGSGPALLAVLLLGERPGPQAVAGTVLVVLSVFVLAGGRGAGGGASSRWRGGCAAGRRSA